MRVPRIGWNALCAATVLVIMGYGVGANGVTVVSPAGFEDIEGGGCGRMWTHY